MEDELQCWSVGDENFNHRSLADLLDENDELKPGDVVLVADAVPPIIGRLCDADDVIDIIHDRAYDIGGDYAEDCANVSIAAKAELNDLLAGWITKHCTLNFWEVKNERPYTLTAADFPQPTAAPEAT